ncbi:MAG TPA: hypothetical protein VGZ22_01300 [Isosphaeraceae bacterium]|jgi:hypothetical protein|nr:hypothetical protein [Isosphaeraceae bacterium]
MTLARDELKQYYKLHGEYPKTWFQLGMQYDGTGGWRPDDPATFAAPEDGNQWQPRHSEYTFTLSTSRSEPIIFASNGKYNIFYMTLEMTVPKKISASHQTRR